MNDLKELAINDLKELAINDIKKLYMYIYPLDTYMKIGNKIILLKKYNMLYDDDGYYCYLNGYYINNNYINDYYVNRKSVDIKNLKVIGKRHTIPKINDIWVSVLHNDDIVKIIFAKIISIIDDFYIIKFTYNIHTQLKYVPIQNGYILPNYLKVNKKDITFVAPYILSNNSDEYYIDKLKSYDIIDKI